MTDDFEVELPDNVMNIINSIMTYPTITLNQEPEPPLHRVQEEIDNAIDYFTLDTDNMMSMSMSMLASNLFVPRNNNYTARNYTARNYNERISSSNDIAHILATSFDTKPKYKHVLSKRGETSLNKITYDPAKHQQTMCPITQNTFEAGDELIELPCKHYFEPDAIEHWLKKEKAECPICRMKLEHVEAEHVEAEPLYYSQLRLLNSLSRIADPHPFGPRRGIESLLNEQDDDDLQIAIIASILGE